jgi:hypothetical protein
MTLRTLGCLLLFAPLAGAGCGGDSKPAVPAAETGAAPAAGDFDPCALLTSGEIQATLGWVPDSTQKKAYGTTGTCTWFGPGGMADQVSLLVGQGMPDMSGSAVMAKWRAEQYAGYDVTDAIVEPVEGLGVPAIRNELAGLVAVEMAVKGQLVSVGSMAPIDKVRTLAGHVAGRMK